MGVIPATSNSPTAPTKGKEHAGHKPLQRDSRLGTYFEYDLSKMINSKGGFLVEDGKEVDEEFIRKEKEREKQRAQQALEPRMSHKHFISSYSLISTQPFISIQV